MIENNNTDDILPYLKQNEGKRWCLIQTKPRNEKHTNLSLLNAGIITYLPLITKVEIHNRSKRETHLPMFAGYVFACPNIAEEPIIRRNKSVWNFQLLTESEEKELIKDLIIVRECELLSKGRKLVINPTLKEGDKVYLKNGPFKNYQVIVSQRKDESRIIVNLDFLGRNIEIICNAADLIF